MKLMTKELEARFKEVGSQQNVKDPIVIASYFNPAGGGRWFATEYDPKTRNIFGYASIFNDHNNEWGYTNLDELEAFKGPMGLGIERDRFWTEKTMTEAKKQKGVV